MDHEIQAEIAALYEALERYGRMVEINTARLINTHLGYEKYAVWIPSNEVVKQ